MSTTLTDIEHAVSSKAPKLKLPSKRALLIAAGGLVLCLLFSAGMIYQVRQERADKAAAAQATVARAAKEAGYQRQITQLEATNHTLAVQKQALCQNYAALSTAKPTRAYVIVPTACTK
jgi:hypothetical protein